MSPQVRYLVYTLAIALCVGYFVQVEIAEPGALKLLTFPDGFDELGTSEYSPLEYIQPIMLIIMAGLYAWVALDCPAQRPIAFLFGGIAAAGAIRELDFFLDRAVTDNFWQVPVGIIAALLIVYTGRHRRRFRIAWLRLWPSTGLTLLFAGAIVQFLFAQMIGHEPLWQAISGDGYQRIVKVAVEEFIELIGYWLWLLGSIEYALQARAVTQKDQLSAGQRRRRREMRKRRSY